MKYKKKDKKKKFEDDGRTVADMQNIDGMVSLFAIKARKPDKIKSNVKNIRETESAPFTLTDKEKRAMTRAAWFLGLKVAALGTGALLLLFLIMSLLVYFWK